MKVKEVMIKDTVSLRPDNSAYDALALLFKMQISGLPVIDAQGKLVGMFTEKDILSYVLPSYIDKVGRFIYEEDSKSTKKKFIELSKMKVGQVMRRDVVTTTENTTLCEAARVILTQRARRLPVVDESGKVVGIVARCDILMAMAKESEMSVDS